MCGRYSFAPKKEKITTQLQDIETPPEIESRYNIAPTQMAYVVANDAPRSLQRFAWGLVPHWSRDGANSGKLINARAEDIEDKPSFRDPIRQRRCLVPADSFYEWRSGPGRQKIPYRISLQNGELLFFAGLWDEWRAGDRPIRTFSIITTTPNREMAELHDRMPVMLRTKEERQLWLENRRLDEVLPLLRTPPDGILTMYRVSEKLNSTSSEGADLHKPVLEQPTLFS